MVIVVLLSTMNAHINNFVKSYSNNPPLPVVRLEEFLNCLVVVFFVRRHWNVRTAFQLCCKAVLTPANLMVNPLVQWWANAKTTWSGFMKFYLKKHSSNGDVLGDALVSESFLRRMLRVTAWRWGWSKFQEILQLFCVFFQTSFWNYSILTMSSNPHSKF